MLDPHYPLCFLSCSCGPNGLFLPPQQATIGNKSCSPWRSPGPSTWHQSLRQLTGSGPQFHSSLFVPGQAALPSPRVGVGVNSPKATGLLMKYCLNL